MEHFLQSLLADTQGYVAYLMVFGILIVCGLGVPIPEDISLILGGVLVHRGAAELPWMMLTGLLGILVGDSLIFFAGRRLGSTIGTRPGGLIGKFITLEKKQKVAALFERYGERIVMVTRFAPGVRAVAYFTAGSSGMKYWRFILFDGLAALVSAPVFIYLGYYFGSKLDMLIANVRQGQTGVFGTLGLILVAYFGFKWWRNRRANTSASPSTSIENSSEKSNT